MKLEIARGLFLVGALGVTSLALAVWKQPGPEILMEGSQGYCPSPPNNRVQVQLRPDHDLLLFLFGMAQGTRAQS